jgi:predicted MFS family arabinose efflux permease
MENCNHGLKRWQVMLMAVCTGLIVANIYYCQPLIVLISEDFKVPESRAGVIAFLTQLGYALGLLFFVPLGDKLERKSQILFTTALAVAALVMAAFAPSLIFLELASLFIGITSIVPQLILPMAAHLSPPHKTGKVVGSVMSGLLIGILLSRTLSGFIGALWGWRAMFGIAAGLTAALLLLMKTAFPQSKPQFTGSYSSLMKSLIKLLKEQPVLREASAINACVFATFGMFWTTMVLHLSSAPFNFHSDTIGLFGLAAAAGALAAPLVGGSADKGNPRVAIGYGIVAALLSFLLFYLFSFSVIAIAVGIIILDLGIQGIHVSNQSRIYALLPAARNRLNTVYMTISFLGTALGSALGLWVWNMSRWTGVCVAGGMLLLLALLIYGSTYKAVPKQIQINKT